MKLKLSLAVAALLIAGCFFLKESTEVAAKIEKPMQWLSHVKTSLPLPRLLQKKVQPEDYSSLSLTETEEEIKKLEETIKDAKTIEELNQNKVTSQKRNEIESLLRTRNMLTDHLLDLKMKEITEKTDSVLSAQKEVIQNALKEMDNE